MKKGLYRLTRDITNPQGDKRCSLDYWHRPTWLMGDRFLVEPFDGEEDHPVIRPLGRVVCPALTFTKHNACVLGLLLPALESDGETLASVLLLAHTSGTSVLTRMLAAGVVDLETVKKFAN